MRLRDNFVIAGVLVAVVLAWLCFALASGAGVNPTGVDWDFSRIGTLGDSFGIISAVMAATAAYFTIRTFLVDRRSALRLRVSEKRRAKAEFERDAEQTLFRLMELRIGMMQEITVSAGLSQKRGAEALSYIAQRLARESARNLTKADKIYKEHYGRWKDKLGNYFRLTYHIVKFADENFDKWKAYSYLRLLRAQLSNSEQILIALNCLYGEGRQKFKGALEYYALLHNIDQADREALALDILFEPEAFDYRESRHKSDTFV